MILAVLSQGRGHQALKKEDFCIFMNGEKMPVVKEAVHMNILRSEDSQESAVSHNIEKAACVHGNNGLDPETSIHLLQTYIVPFLVYGLQVLLPRKTLLDKKFLNMILSLPATVADPAKYVLSGSTHV